MRVWFTKDYAAMSRLAANIISAGVVLKNDSVLGLSTGSTPVGIYKELIERYSAKDVDFSKVTVINQDEYIGLPKDSDQSYAYFMYHNFYKGVNVAEKNRHIPNGENLDIAKECKRYEKVISDAGGIDMLLLGIGSDGHIAFNEPGEVFKKYVHAEDLNENTIEANSRFFDSLSDVPKRAYTIGIKNIMDSRRIVLAVNGEHKAEILSKAVLGSITPQVPASILQLHPNVDVVADEKALKKIIELSPDIISNLNKI